MAGICRFNSGTTALGAGACAAPQFSDPASMTAPTCTGTGYPTADGFDLGPVRPPIWDPRKLEEELYLSSIPMMTDQQLADEIAAQQQALDQATQQDDPVAAQEATDKLNALMDAQAYRAAHPPSTEDTATSAQLQSMSDAELKSLDRSLCAAYNAAKDRNDTAALDQIRHQLEMVQGEELRRGTLLP